MQLYLDTPIWMDEKSIESSISKSKKKYEKNYDNFEGKHKKVSINKSRDSRIRNRNWKPKKTPTLEIRATDVVYVYVWLSLFVYLSHSNGCEEWNARQNIEQVFCVCMRMPLEMTMTMMMNAIRIRRIGAFIRLTLSRRLDKHHSKMNEWKIITNYAMALPLDVVIFFYVDLLSADTIQFPRLFDT